MKDKENIWLNALIATKEILNKYNCHYFLDNGTLLGAIRDKKFIPWDNDIDIGVVNTKCTNDLIIKISEDFYDRGFNVTSTIDSVNLSDDSGMIDLGIKFYEFENDLYSTHLGRCEGSMLFSSLSLFVSDDFVYKKARNKFVFKALLANMFKSVKSFIPKLIKDWMVKKANMQFVTVSVPRELLSDLGECTFYNEVFSVPKNFQGYLKYRYGEKWMTPLKAYNYMQMDGAIKK